MFPLEAHAALKALVLFGCIYQNHFLFCFPLSVLEADWSKICLTSGFLFHKFSITLMFPDVNWANVSSDLNEPGIEVRHKCHKIQNLCMISKLNEAKLSNFVFRSEDNSDCKAKRKSGISNAAEVSAAFEATSH